MSTTTKTLAFLATFIGITAGIGSGSPGIGMASCMFSFVVMGQLDDIHERLGDLLKAKESPPEKEEK